MQTNINWSPNAAEEQVTEYGVYVDDALAGKTPTNSMQADLLPGAHKVEVSAFNIWGEGPKSDPVVTPPVCSKPSGISISINITINT